MDHNNLRYNYFAYCTVELGDLCARRNCCQSCTKLLYGLNFLCVRGTSRNEHLESIMDVLDNNVTLNESLL